MTKLPSGVTVARQPGGTTTVLIGSSRIAGPSMLIPGASDAGP